MNVWQRNDCLKKEIRENVFNECKIHLKYKIARRLINLKVRVFVHIANSM